MTLRQAFLNLCDHYYHYYIFAVDYLKCKTHFSEDFEELESGKTIQKNSYKNLLSKYAKKCSIERILKTLRELESP